VHNKSSTFLARSTTTGKESPEHQKKSFKKKHRKEGEEGKGLGGRRLERGGMQGKERRKAVRSVAWIHPVPEGHTQKKKKNGRIKHVRRHECPSESRSGGGRGISGSLRWQTYEGERRKTGIGNTGGEGGKIV